MRTLAVIVAPGQDAARLRRAMRGVPGLDAVQVVVGAAQAWADAMNAGLAAATAQWVMFVDGAEPSQADLRHRGRFLARYAGPELAVVATADAAEAVVPVGGLTEVPRGLGSGWFRRDLLQRSALGFDCSVRRSLAATMLGARYLLANTDKTAAWLAPAGLPAPAREPDRAIWGDPATYDHALIQGYLAPLEDAARRAGRAPRWLQLAVVRDLQWYFTVDARERAPTMVVTEAMASVVHARIAAIMRHIDVEVLCACELDGIAPEVRHALLAYKGVPGQSPVAATVYDAEQGLARIAYYVHGDRPEEVLAVDGEPASPAYGKYRACRYFRRTLFHERIAWLPCAGNSSVTTRIGRDGAALGPAPAGQRLDGAAELDPELLRREPMRVGAPGPSLPARAQAHATRWLARLPRVRERFAGAWVFVDRDEDADDNAEHMYRWVRAHHPEISAFFLLDPASPDWPRLAQEGFRLVPPGLERTLLLLNCAHIVSSHAEYQDGRLSRAVYGDLICWRYTFVEHGHCKDDVSHWLNRLAFDLFTVAGPRELASFVADDTTYSYTAREVRMTGLPRHDRLLALSRETDPAAVDVLLVMPTWRARPGELRRAAESSGGQARGFAASAYATRWRSFLNNPDLRDVADRHGRKIVFMLHVNAQEYIDDFAPPAHVAVCTKADTSFLPLLSRSVAMVTDYTSVAFEMALLRRCVFYYQFDRDEFYGGQHNWRPGYFDYDRDGFGPVATDEAALVANIAAFLAGGSRPQPEYLRRMEATLPEPDGRCCERVFASICEVTQPYRRRKPA